jgi:hypothetical protein
MNGSRPPGRRRPPLNHRAASAAAAQQRRPVCRPAYGVRGTNKAATGEQMASHDRPASSLASSRLCFEGSLTLLGHFSSSKPRTSTPAGQDARDSVARPPPADPYELAERGRVQTGRPSPLGAEIRLNLTCDRDERRPPSAFSIGRSRRRRRAARERERSGGVRCVQALAGFTGA